MASDRWYNPGDNYLLDDLSGLKIRRSRSRIIPGGQTGQLAVAPERWEAQHPQDLVQGVVDDQSVPLARPRQVNRFTVLGTVVTAFAGRGALSMQVDSTVGFQIGDVCQVPLDDGNLFQFTVSAIAGSILSWTSPGLPGTVGGSFSDPLENSVIDVTATQRGGTFSDGSISH